MSNESLFKKCLKEKILFLDGAMGTLLQKYNLSENDYRGTLFKNSTINLKGNFEVLSLTQPQIIEDIHRAYLDAGADIIECNTFNSNSIVQSNYHLENSIKELNKASVKIARKIADEYTKKTPNKPRFIAGSIGPTTKSLTISSDIMNPEKRDITFDELVKSYSEQVEVLICSDIDILLIETIFDTLNAKAAIYAIQEVQNRLHTNIPTMISVTLTDKSGRTLSGQTLEAFYYSIEFAKPICIGLNCSLGIEEMKPHIKQLAEIAPCAISIYANAGLQNEFGEYETSPIQMANEYKELATDNIINIYGGCCGTTPDHIKEIVELLKYYKPREITTKKKLQEHNFCGLTPLTINSEFIQIGENTNISNSKDFRTAILNNNFDKAINIAQKQIKNGAKIIEICLDSEQYNTKEIMKKFLNRIATEPNITQVPIMLTSTDFDLIKTGLKCIQSKVIVNSISLENGEKDFINKAIELQKFGSSIVVNVSDEQGSATDTNRRIKIIDRAYKILTEKCNYNPNDIIFDLNVIPIATGIKEQNSNAISFLEALKILKQKYPDILFLGRISNVSFAFNGNNKIQDIIHSIFLHHAIKNGLSMGILSPRQLLKYENIEKRIKSLIENVIFNKSEDAQNKLIEYINSNKNILTNKKENLIISEWRTLPVNKRLQYALLKGTDEFIKPDLYEALTKYKPVDIIEKILLEEMNILNDYFSEGKMFLPQVVKSSRIMKKAIDILQTKLKTQNKYIGKIVLATVKGDVHDIGKNILSLVLTCHNFKVIDLGIMVDSTKILETAKKENADIIALSGLINSSLEEIQQIAKDMEIEGFKLPALMIGGATTSKKHTAIKIAPKYKGLVIHTTNASEAAFVAKKIIKKDKKFIQKIQDEQKEILNEYLKDI